MSQPKVLAHVRFDVYQMDDGTFEYVATSTYTGAILQEYKTGDSYDLFDMAGNLFIDQCVFKEEPK